MRKLKLEELGRISIEEFKETEKMPVTVILDDVRSMYNVGSVFRTSDAFVIEKIFLCGITAAPPHKEIRKTALGATESVDWEYHKEVIRVVEQLKEEGYTIVSVEQAEGSTQLSDMEWNSNSRYALIFGNEVEGVSQTVVDKSDYCLEVPQAGTKHSLNISVCAGIVLWDIFEEFKI